MNGGYGFHASTVERRGRFVVACERYLSRTLPTRAPAARIRLLLTVNGDETWLTTRRKRIPPVGESTMISSERGLAAILWEGDNPKRVRLEPQREDPNNDILVETERQLKSYFDGTLKVFSVPLDFVGTEFQTTVWKALLNIPFGQTRTYTQIAKQIGRPTAARAVGAASGKNPISIMAPCHRVIGANGDLTGFAGGLDTKELLLALEQDGGSVSAGRTERGL